ncbi:MAG TPA: aspartate aminotransferase family protein, partial [Candidatus Binatia bacterium]|nr:aspartate aminotransferase family protein [Candidatus Binatia bacterium]
IGLEIVDKEGQPDRMTADRIRDACLARGLVVIECGVERHILRIAPPLNLTFVEWAEGLHVLSSAMEEICGK